MTPRSPKQQPKTTTISRRLRNRADQHLSVQPPELSHLRGLRAQRAATLPSKSLNHAPINYSGPDNHINTWNPNFDVVPRSNTSHPAQPVQVSHSNLLLQEALDIATYESPRNVSTKVEREPYRLHPSSSPVDLVPSPLPSLSGSHTATEFDLRLSADPEPPHHSSLELQDMRYDIMLAGHM